MTLRERLQIIGRAMTKGELPTREIIREVKEKGVLGGFIDLFGDQGLITIDKASEKLLKANHGWVYKNNDLIARAVSNIELELYNVRRVGQEIEYVPIPEHPLLDLLDRFNDYTNQSDAMYMTSSYKNLAGDAFWYVEGAATKNPLNIKNIYLLRPDKITLQFGDNAPGQRTISRYIFKDIIAGKENEVTYKPEEIIQFKSPNPENPYRGKSKVEAVAEAIDTDNYATEAQKALYKRGMINNFILSTDKSLTTEQRKVIRADINKNYSGVVNAFRVLLLSGGLKPESIQLSNKEMEFIAQQEWLRDKITAVFGNPKALVTTDDVNLNNAETTIKNWKQTTVKGEMQSIVDNLNEYLVPLFGSNLLLGFKDPSPEDESTKIDRIVKLKNAKIITPNEARQELGYDEIKEDGADQLTEPTKEMPDPVKNVNWKKSFRKMGIRTEIKRYKEAKSAARVVAKKLLASRKPKTKEIMKPQHDIYTDEQIEKYYEKQIRIVDGLESAFENAVKQFIDRIVDKAIERVPDEIADIQQKALYDEDELIVQATIDFTPLLNDVAILAGQEALGLIGDDSPFISRNLRAKIEANVRKFTKSMLDTDRDKIIDIIAQGIANGESVPAIREAIKSEFVDYSKMQAQRITRTEVLRASNQGSLVAFKESNVVIGKQWLTAGAVDQCAEYNGKIIYDLDGNFYTSENQFEDGDPPLHPNCRCIVLPVLDVEAAYKPAPIHERTILQDQIKSLEEQIDKRTKAYKEIKEQSEKQHLDDQEYIKELEKIVNENRTDTKVRED